MEREPCGWERRFQARMSAEGREVRNSQDAGDVPGGSVGLEGRQGMKDREPCRLLEGVWGRILDFIPSVRRRHWRIVGREVA